MLSPFGVWDYIFDTGSSFWDFLCWNRHDEEPQRGIVTGTHIDRGETNGGATDSNPGADTTHKADNSSGIEFGTIGDTQVHIKINSKGGGRWIQTIDTNNVLQRCKKGTTSPYVDPCWESDNYPFYYTESARKFANAGVLFRDDEPERKYSHYIESGEIRWIATVSEVTWNRVVNTLTINQAYTYGFTFNASGIHPISPRQATKSEIDAHTQAVDRYFPGYTFKY